MTDELQLARRLERAEGTANAAFVEARASADPTAGATWTEIAGVYCMFDGAGSPLTQTFGLGLFDPFLEPEFEKAESFFFAHGSATTHEVCSLTPEATTRLLPTRGYAPIEASVVLVRPTGSEGDASSGHIDVRRIGPDECDHWAEVCGEGWSSEGAELTDFVRQLGRISARARGAHCFLAESGGKAIGAAALNISSDVAVLAGASTIPAARRQGAQTALLNARLAYAAELGIGLAMVVTQPESASQRNAERRGFRAVYSRMKWERQISP